MIKRYYGLFLLEFILLVSILNPIVNADSVVYENQYGKLEVYPIIESNGLTRHIQYVNVTPYINKIFDVAFKFDVEIIQPDIYIKRKIGERLKCDPIEELEMKFINGSWVEWYNTIGWNNYTIDIIGWDKISHKFNKIYYNGNPVFVCKEIDMVKDKLYQFKFVYTTNISTSGKWDLYVKPSELNLYQAIQQNKYIHIDPWWDSDWGYYKVCNINDPLDDYQLTLIVGNSSGGNVTCEGHANPDFSDLRFIRTDNSTELYYWIENYTTDTQATVWINNSYNDSQILMYYGNNGASTTEDGWETFIFFDDCEGGEGIDTLWEVHNETSSWVNYHATASYEGSYGIYSYDHAGGASNNWFRRINYSYPAMRIGFMWQKYWISSTSYVHYNVIRTQGDISGGGWYGNVYTTPNAGTGGDIQYYSSGLHDTGYDWFYQTWSKVEFQSYDTGDDTDYSHVFWFSNLPPADIDFHDCGDVRRQELNPSAVGGFCSSSGTSALTDEFFDNIYFANWTRWTKPTWGTFGSEVENPAGVEHSPTFTISNLWLYPLYIEYNFNVSDVEPTFMKVNITLDDDDGNLMNISLYWRESLTDVYTLFNYSTNLTNGSYSFTGVDFIDDISTKYYFSFNLTDGTNRWANTTRWTETIQPDKPPSLNYNWSIISICANETVSRFNSYFGLKNNTHSYSFINAIENGIIYYILLNLSEETTSLEEVQNVTGYEGYLIMYVNDSLGYHAFYNESGSCDSDDYLYVAGLEFEPITIVFLLFFLFYYLANKHEDVGLMYISAFMLLALGIYYLAELEVLSSLFGISIIVASVYSFGLAMSFSAGSNRKK